MSDITHLDPGQPPAAATEVLEGLYDLLKLDHDAIGAYEIAMEKLEDRDHADQIAGFLRDHERHIRELNELVLELGGTAITQPHATGVFKSALQSLGALAGDRGLLMAFRANEQQVRAKYDGYAARANLWPARVKRVIDLAALDEERHYHWVNDVLGRQGAGEEAVAAVDLAAPAHEVAAAGSGPVHEARERLAGAADTVRGALSGVGEKLSETLGPVGERVAGGAGAVRDSVTAGAGRVRNRIAGLVDDAGAAGESTVGSVRDRVRVVSGGVRDASGSVEERFHERPLQTLLIAGVAGFFIGRMLR